MSCDCQLIIKENDDDDVDDYLRRRRLVERTGGPILAHKLGVTQGHRQCRHSIEHNTTS